jgi:hypothetical protein
MAFGAFWQVAHEVTTNYWASYDGHMPSDIPKCGFDGSLCDYTKMYITAGVFLFLAGLTSFLH